MPFYEYQCQACGAQVEVMQKISDAPLKKCPDCRKPKLVKLMSAPVFRLKGGGWYETDFKSDGEAKRNLVGEEKEPAAASKDEAAAKPSESKPADAKPAEGGGADKPAASSKPAARTAAAKPRPSKPAVRTARKTPARKPAAKRRPR